MSDPTRVEQGDDDPSTVDAPVRWKGAAAVVPPAPKTPRWKSKRAFVSAEPDDDDREAIPAVDPWAGQDPEATPWDSMPVALPPPMPPTRLEQLPRTQVEPPVMPTVNRTPVQPRPLPPRPAQSRPAVPLPPPRPVQKPKKQKAEVPQKYVQQSMKERRPSTPAPPPPRRKRRRPFRALFKLAFYTVVLYVLAVYVWPVVQPDVSRAVPELVAYIKDVVLQNV